MFPMYLNHVGNDVNFSDVQLKKPTLKNMFNSFRLHLDI